MRRIRARRVASCPCALEREAGWRGNLLTIGCGFRILRRDDAGPHCGCENYGRDSLPLSFLHSHSSNVLHRGSYTRADAKLSLLANIRCQYAAKPKLKAMLLDIRCPSAVMRRISGSRRICLVKHLRYFKERGHRGLRTRAGDGDGSRSSREPRAVRGRMPQCQANRERSVEEQLCMSAVGTNRPPLIMLVVASAND
jgi:hypothetical protein